MPTQKAKQVTKAAVKTTSARPSADTRKRLFKRFLVEAAVELFKAKGFDAVTITEIAEKAGIARRTFFLYFPTKEDILIQWHDDEWNHATELLLTRHAAKAPFDAFASALLELGAHFDLNRERALAITRITLENPSVFGREYVNQFGWQTRWALLLRQVQKAPQSQALSYEVHAAAAFSVVAFAARRWLDDPRQKSFCVWLEKGFKEVRTIAPNDTANAR